MVLPPKDGAAEDDVADDWGAAPKEKPPVFGAVLLVFAGVDPKEKPPAAGAGAGELCAAGVEDVLPKENPPAGLGAAAPPAAPKEKAGVVDEAALVEAAGVEALLPKLKPPAAGWVGVAGLLLLLAAPKPLKPPPKAVRRGRRGN